MMRKVRADTEDAEPGPMEKLEVSVRTPELVPQRGHAEAAREILATRIIEEAKLGELNKVRLRDDALAHLAHHLRNLPRRGQP